MDHENMSMLDCRAYPDFCAVIPANLREGIHMNINKMTNIISWALIIIGIIFIFWKLFGGSPTEFNILIVLVAGILFRMMGIGNDISGLKEKARNMENKFNALASDFKEHVKQDTSI